MEPRLVTGYVFQTDIRTKCIHLIGSDERNYILDYSVLFGSVFGTMDSNCDTQSPLPTIHPLHPDNLAKACLYKAEYARIHKRRVKVWGTFRHISELDIPNAYSAKGFDHGQKEHPYAEWAELAETKYQRLDCFVMTDEGGDKYRPNTRSNIVVEGLDDEELPTLQVNDDDIRSRSKFYTIIGRVTGFDGRTYVCRVKPEAIFLRVLRKTHSDPDQYTVDHSPIANISGHVLIDFNNCFGEFGEAEFTMAIMDVVYSTMMYNHTNNRVRIVGSFTHVEDDFIMVTGWENEEHTKYNTQNLLTPIIENFPVNDPGVDTLLPNFYSAVLFEDGVRRKPPKK